MSNEEVAHKLVDHITEVQDYLDTLFYWLRYCTEIDSKEYQEGTNKVKQLLQELQMFDPSDNQPKHPRITLSDAEGNVLGTSESTKNAEYPSITLYDAGDNTIGRCDSITGNTASGMDNIMYLHGVSLYNNKSIDDLKKVEFTIPSMGLESYLVLTSMKLLGSDNSFRCVTLKLN